MLQPEQSHRTRIGIIITALFVVAFLVRVGGLGQKGLFLQDEADIALRVRTYVTLAKVLPSAVVLWWQGDAEALRSFSYAAFPSGFFPSLMGMPAHIVPGIILALIFGEHDWTLVLWNAFLATLTVLLVYLIIRRISGKEVPAVIGALLLALSPYHVLYSRTAHAQISAGFFFILGEWAYMESFYVAERVRYRFLFLAGISLSLMFSSHYGTLPMLFFLGCFELAIGIAQFRGRLAGRWGVLTAGVCMPIFFWQILLSLRASLFTRAGYAVGSTQSYFGEAISAIYAATGLFTETARPQPELSYFFDLIQYAHGWAFTLFFVSSALLTVIAFKRRSLALGVCVWLTWTPVIFYSLLYVQAPRRFVVCLPLAVVCVALVLNYLGSFISHKRLAAAFVVAAGIFLLGASLPRLKDEIQLRSPYPQAAGQAKVLAGNRMVMATPWTLYQYYGNTRIESLPSSQHSLKPVMFVTDWTSLNFPEALALLQHRTPFLEIPNPVGSSYFLLRDVLGGYSRQYVKGLASGDEPHSTSIRFYDLAK